ncbi:VOC family protein [Microcoleus sp. FACHB-1515]|uniref:ArsI/CadI family heavy metal resistance metalloenzyme n=1 Tax=Cyanophyceae TaxID=3028117 RepID=UPI001688A044|nr:ArsI/CadI family heavy metal resistance metalloenzyme [Microcoleus sp. FACHB-1515]MBD2090601.1 VOC family protein [Microcoleus sp. FACHB-1515]
MTRIQIALNVSGIDVAVDFYSKLFDAQPAKRRPGYANFAIAHPPLKLVLIENPAAAGQLNHLGIEVESSEQVSAANERIQQTGLSVDPEHSVACCYAVQDKIWLKDPDGADWEIYTVLQDSDTFGKSRNNAQACCS